MSTDDDISAAWKEVNSSTDWAGMQGTARNVGKALLPSVMPVAGAIGLTPILGPVGGAAVGGMMGEVGNQMLGITDPSVGSIALQGAIPPALKGMAGLKRISGAFGEKAGAETLNRLAAPEIRALLESYQPSPSASKLFGMLHGHEANIPVQPYVEAIQKVKKDIGVSSPGYRRSYAGLQRNVEGSEQGLTYDTQTKQPVLPIQKFQREMHDVGTHTQASEPMERGAYKQLYGGLAKSLESASLPGSKGQVLKEAREAFKREKVLEEIGDLARPFTMSGHGDVERFRANKIINRLKDPQDELAKFYQQSFTPEEQAKLMGSLVNLNKIPPIPAPRGADAGSRERLGQIASVVGMGGAGGLAGSSAGLGPEAAAMGAGIGYVVPKIATMIQNYNIANNTETGKALIKELWRGNGGKFSPEFWSAIHAFAAQQAANPQAELFQRAGR